jgi:hypothetical protein
MLIDPLGADTSFANNIVKADFNEALQNVDNKIQELTESIDRLRLSESKRDMKELEGLTSVLEDWQKLKADFNRIIESEVCFKFSNNVHLLAKSENGLVDGPRSEVYRPSDGVVTGVVYIYIRPGHDETIIHENRHLNQILDGSHSRPLMEREREAFVYQRIYSPKSVNATIENARLQKYGRDMAQNMRKWTLDDMIKYLYGD